MSSRLEMKKQRLSEKRNGIYFEGHHIIPKSKGGTGNSNRPKNNPNIVLLTAREHFLAHWLLWRIYRDRQTSLAFHKMTSSNKNQNRILSSRGYQEARESFSNTNKGNQYGKGQKRIVSESQKKNLSEKMKGKFAGDKNPFYGKNHSDETKKKLSESRKKITQEKIWNYGGNKLLFKDEKFVISLKTVQEVADFLKTSVSNVYHGLNGSQKTVKGYKIFYEKNV